MADRFYVNSALQLGPVVIQGAEAHHLAVVCRLRPGDRVSLFNGDGREYHAEIRTVAKKAITLEVIDVQAPVRERSHRLEIAAPLPKGDRGQFLVEKLTELGVTRYIPLRTERSVVHPAEVRLEKLQRYVIEASKQCGRNVLMQVDCVRSWRELCRDAAAPLRRFLAHPGGEPYIPPSGEGALCVVGPEGG